MTTTEQTSRFFRFRKTRDRRTCSLEVQDITVTTDDNTVVLDDLSMELEPGTKTCIVGTNELAQATLLSCLSGDTKVTSGVIRLNGTDLTDLSSAGLRQGLMVVPRNPPVERGSIRDNITMDLPGVSRHQLEWAVAQAQIDSFARFLPEGIDTVVSDGSGRGHAPAPIVLSPGQRRRVALARALLFNPSVLVLEDPTIDLNTHDERRFLRSLDDLVAGRTLIVFSRRLIMARRTDQILVLADGKLAPYDEVATRGMILDHSRVWEVRTQPINADDTATTEAEVEAVLNGNDNGPDCRNDRGTDGGNDAPDSGHVQVFPSATSSRRAVHLARPRSSANSEPWGITIGSEIAPGYVASGLLERTAHADVWTAWSAEREAPVRVKVPASAPVTYHAFEQIQREFQTISGLRHPGLSSAYEIDVDAEMPYAVFEYFDSPSLSSLINRQRSGLDPLDVLYIGFELAGALNYLHHRGRVHLDLRTRHVRTRADTIVITDFTNSRPIASPIPAQMGTGSGQRGEHRAMPPEQRPGATANPKMDIYSLGALMHFAAAGSVRSELTPWGKRLVPFGSLMDSAPMSLIEIVDRMLAQDPADRPEAEEVLARFRRVLPQSLYRPRITDLDDRPRLQLVVSNN